ncbi:hypothetical protein ABMA27_015675 [Loxostege sticticalis]|uniref:Arrestin C-terminal-like domain-containing protein n=1 Tax=Loxostege sticticalis TaxID=481309 RepID=A0ABR3I8H0_LOXSC
MGIYCATDIHTPPGGIFAPGSSVTGVVRYTIDEGISVDEVIISLKGVGKLVVEKNPRSRYSTIYIREEEYVNVATIVKTDDNQPIKCGKKYETEFNFTLPVKIPSSLEHKKLQGKYEVAIHIYYNIRTKFLVAGRFSLNKKFTKEIKVANTEITPTLLMIPNIHGQRRKLFQPFRKAHSIVNIKATVQSSVLLPGGKLEIAYEVQNNSNLVVEAIKTNLFVAYDFYASKTHIVKQTRRIKDLESKSGAVKSRDSFKSSCEFMLPPDLHNITQYSKLVKRGYFFLITVKLPSPYHDVNLRIPLEIGNPVYNTVVSNELHQKADNLAVKDRYIESAGTSHDPPPSYWQSIEDIDAQSLVEDGLKRLSLSDDDGDESNAANGTNKTTVKKKL